MEYVTIELVSAETSEDIKVEKTLFFEAKKILEKKGFTFGQAIELFLKYVVEHGVPFTQEEIQAYKDSLAQ